MAQEYSSLQRAGSEYGGVPHTPSGIQPKPEEAFTNTERLRLGYTTGNEADFMSLEDRRQFLGLRPANGARPIWLGGVSPIGDPRLDSVASLQQQVQFDIDAEAVSLEPELDEFWTEEDIDP